MKRVFRIASYVLAVAVILLIIGLIVIDIRFGVIRSAPEISYETVLPPDARITVVAAPNLARDYLALLLPGVWNKRPWVLDWLVPQQISVSLAPDFDKQTLGTVLFINEKRLGRYLKDQLNRQKTMTNIPQSQWANNGWTHPRRGCVLAEGTLPLSSKITDGISAIWKTDIALPPLTVEGGHLLEAVLDNHDGGAYAALVAVLSLEQQKPEMLMTPQVTDAVRNITRIRLWADPAQANSMSIQLRVECRPETDSVQMGQLNFQIRMLYSLASAQLSKKYGATLTGNSEIKEQTIEGDYVLSGADKLIAALVSRQ